MKTPFIGESNADIIGQDGKNLLFPAGNREDGLATRPKKQSKLENSADPKTNIKTIIRQVEADTRETQDRLDKLTK